MGSGGVQGYGLSAHSEELSGQELHKAQMALPVIMVGEHQSQLPQPMDAKLAQPIRYTGEGHLLCPRTSRTKQIQPRVDGRVGWTLETGMETFAEVLLWFPDQRAQGGESTPDLGCFHWKKK